MSGVDAGQYRRRARVRVRDGHAITGGALAPCLSQLGAFEDSYPRFVAMRERHGLPKLAFQVGFPSHQDYALGAFGDAWRDAEIYAACRDATAQQISTIHDRAGDDVLFQIETVAGAISVTGAELDDQPALARDTAAMLAELVESTPDGARFAVHLCVGDLNHKALGRLDDTRSLVLLANAIAAAWPAGRRLELIHVPFAAAAEPPVFDDAFYLGLEELELPDHVRLAAGFIHESVALDETRRLLATIEGHAGREVDVAAPCGLGRRADPAQAWDAMEKAAALIGPAQAAAV